MKVAGHELKGLMNYFKCKAKGIYFPMCCLIEYRGYRFGKFPRNFSFFQTCSNVHFANIVQYIGYKKLQRVEKLRISVRFCKCRVECI